MSCPSYTCDCCGSVGDLHSHGYCISNLRARIECLEERINDQDFEVKPAQPEPKAGQVWRDDDAARFCLLTHRHAGSRWANVDLANGSHAIDDPIERRWTYVCDGAVPASEVRP